MQRQRVNPAALGRHRQAGGTPSGISRAVEAAGEHPAAIISVGAQADAVLGTQPAVIHIVGVEPDGNCTVTIGVEPTVILRAKGAPGRRVTIPDIELLTRAGDKPCERTRVRTV